MIATQPLFLTDLNACHPVTRSRSSQATRIPDVKAPGSIIRDQKIIVDADVQRRRM